MKRRRLVAAIVVLVPWLAIAEDIPVQLRRAVLSAETGGVALYRADFTAALVDEKITANARAQISDF